MNWKELGCSLPKPGFGDCSKVQQQAQGPIKYYRSFFRDTSTLFSFCNLTKSAPHNLASDSSTSFQILSRWIIIYLHLAPLLAQIALRRLSREFDRPRQIPTTHGTRCISLPPDAMPTRLPLASPVTIAASRPLSTANLSVMHNLGRCLFLSRGFAATHLRVKVIQAIPDDA